MHVGEHLQLEGGCEHLEIYASSTLTVSEVKVNAGCHRLKTSQDHLEGTYARLLGVTKFILPCTYTLMRIG